ncbi:MAG TPA: serine/threonine-protein kinase, partial [Gemmatimonadales bacterium]|nr:serine/threonine-protein kinase [Gemmatimonadales bacterium]
IYKVGESGGVHYIVMKFIEGRPLDAIIQVQGALPVGVVVAVLRATASALAYAHERGTIHRDIKSSNILVDQEGRVYVSDFGLARAAEDSKVTPSGAVIGTPQFMSPEQCSGAPVGPQGDQYSLGIVGFHMLAGTAPFEASSVLAVVQHHYFTPPPDLQKIRNDVPDALATIVRRCVEKDPARRFTNTSDLVTALEALPFHDDDQRAAKDILRRLARGYRVPIVQTTELPPLPDARVSTASAIMRWTRHFTPRALLTIGLGTAVMLSGAWLGLRAARPHAPVEPPPPAVAEPLPPPPPVAPARSTRPAPPAQPRTMGRVRLRTEPPDAVILIDGQQAGIGTVFDIAVPTGVRHLRIRASGSVTLDTTFEVTAGNTTRLGLITLRSLP